MDIQIDCKTLVLKKPVADENWRVWERKTFNLHRGVIDWPITETASSIDDIAAKLRSGVQLEFRPGRFRGFGFGTILHFQNVPSDCGRLCEYVDTRNRKDGVWQWIILCFDEVKRAIGIHTWQHGYLRPVYESILGQLRSCGYECESVDKDVDTLVAMLQRIASYHPARIIAKELFG